MVPNAALRSPLATCIRIFMSAKTVDILTAWEAGGKDCFGEVGDKGDTFELSGFARPGSCKRNNEGTVPYVVAWKSERC